MNRNERTAIATAVVMVVVSVLDFKKFRKVGVVERKKIKVEEGLEVFAQRSASRKIEERFRNGDYAHKSVADVQNDFKFELIVAKLGM